MSMTPKALSKELNIITTALVDAGNIIDELLCKEGDEWGCYGPAMKQIHKAHKAIGRLKAKHGIETASMYDSVFLAFAESGKEVTP